MKKKSNWLIYLFGLFLVFRLSVNVYRLWKAGDVVKQAQNELEEAKAQNQKLERKLAEVQSEEFLEREAREKLGYGKPGEIVVLLPEENSTKDEVLSAKEDIPNWRKWRKLYLGF